jgi:hypothetical protein
MEFIEAHAAVGHGQKWPVVYESRDDVVARVVSEFEKQYGEWDDE